MKSDSPRLEFINWIKKYRDDMENNRQTILGLITREREESTLSRPTAVQLNS